MTPTGLTALGFAVGGTVHAVSLVLLAGRIELYGAGYPAWRHVAMALVDASIAWIALRGVPWLVFALLAFLAEQLSINRRFEATSAVVLVAAICATWDRWFRRSR